MLARFLIGSTVSVMLVYIAGCKVNAQDREFNAGHAVTDDKPVFTHGVSSDHYTLTIRNDGGLSMPIQKVYLSGPNRFQFIINENKCVGKSIEPDNTDYCAITIGFNGDWNISHAPYTADLVVEYNGRGSPLKVPLKAIFVEPH
jgi:hypothetical protein